MEECFRYAHSIIDELSNQLIRLNEECTTAQERMKELTGVEEEYEQREIELTTDEYHQIWQEEISDQTDVIKRHLLHWDPDAFVIPVLPSSVYLVITSIKLSGIYANKKFG